MLLLNNARKIWNRMCSGCSSYLYHNYVQTSTITLNVNNILDALY